VFSKAFSKLDLVEPMINASLPYKIVVGPHLLNMALVDDDDAISALDSRKTMGDNQRGSTFDKPTKGILDKPFCLGVYAGGGLI
jgi:hypothetical protein